MAAYFYMDSPVAPLFADCLFGFIAGALLRRFAFRLVTSIALPLGIAFICAGPGDLLFGQGEPQGWSMIVLVYLFAWGLLVSVVATALGHWSRRWLFSLP